MTNPDFQIEIGAGGRVKVSWEDAACEYSFSAITDGEVLGELRGAGHRREPTVTVVRKGGGRGRVSYDPALTYAGLIASFTAEINERRLIPPAIAAKQAEIADREARHMASKAETVRRIMGQHGLPVPELTDAALAAFFDDIQNAAGW